MGSEKRGMFYTEPNIRNVGLNLCIFASGSKWWTIYIPVFRILSIIIGEISGDKKFQYK